MRREYFAGKSGDWEEEFWGSGKLSMWASAKVRDCYSEVEQEDDGRVSIAENSLR